MAIPLVGKCFPTAKELLDYLDAIKFGAWSPNPYRGPSFATRKTYSRGTRKVPITDEQWMKNVASHYGNKLGWSAGPQHYPRILCSLILLGDRGPAKPMACR